MDQIETFYDEVIGEAKNPTQIAIKLIVMEAIAKWETWKPKTAAVESLYERYRGDGWTVTDCVELNRQAGLFRDIMRNGSITTWRPDPGGYMCAIESGSWKRIS